MSGSVRSRKSAIPAARKSAKARATAPVREARRAVARAKPTKARRPLIFISYSRPDMKATKALARFLRKQGFEPWWDREIPAGSDFLDEIDRRLEEAAAVIVIWSETARSSTMVKEEAGTARDVRKLIATHLPSFDAKRLPLGFRNVNSIPVDDRKLLMKSLKRYLPRPRRAGKATEGVASSAST